MIFVEVVYVVEMSCSRSGNALKNFTMFNVAGRLRDEREEWEGLDAWKDAPLLCAQRMSSHETRSGVLVCIVVGVSRGREKMDRTQDRIGCWHLSLSAPKERHSFRQGILVP